MKHSKNNNLMAQVEAFKQRDRELKARGFFPVTFIEDSPAPIDKAKSQSYLGATDKTASISFGDGVNIGDEVLINRYRSPVNVPDCGTPGKGYIKYGEDNLTPVKIARLAKALPYTASGLRYIIDHLGGNGLAFKYKYTRIVNGKCITDTVPYEEAELLLKNRIYELRQMIGDGSSPKHDGVPLPAYAAVAGGENGTPTGNMQYRTKAVPKPEPSEKFVERNYEDAGTLQAQLDQAIKDLRKWEETMEWLTEFKRNTACDELVSSWAFDDTHYGLSFFRLMLEQGETKGWGQVEGTKALQTLTKRPRIVGIKYQSLQVSRFEERDENLHINYVYHAERWRYDGTIKDQNTEICAHPYIETDSRWHDLTDIVMRNQRTPPSERPTVCTSVGVKNVDSSYYPVQEWWSIFSSMIYNLAATLMSDTAVARRNSTMWSKIVYLDLDWFERFCTAHHAETDEEREELRNQVISGIRDFLRERNNNGKIVVGDKMQSHDEKKSVYSFEVVDIPAPSSKSSLEDLESVTSCIFFALGIHPALVGAVPGKTSTSSSGTQQRELTLLKICQLIPRRRLFLSMFYFIRDWDDLDTHLTFEIPDFVLSTLDRSNTGLVEQTL